MKCFDWNSSIKEDMNSIYYRLDKIEKTIDGFYSSYNDIFSKVNGLYKGDHHGTLRPKVDMLEDATDKFEQSVWIEMSKLQDRIKELEGKKK